MPARTRKELQDLKAELAATGAETAAAPKPRRHRAAAHPHAPEAPPPDVEAPAPEAPAAASEAEAAAEAEPETATFDQLHALVRDLQEALHEATEKAEDAVTSHPAAALASAFLLGLLVGRAWR